MRKHKALAIAPQWYQYRRQSHDLLQWLDNIERTVAEFPDPPEASRVKVLTYRDMYTKTLLQQIRLRIPVDTQIDLTNTLSKTVY